MATTLPRPILSAALAADRRGTALLELAFALPILLAFLMGIMAYGSWFLIAHTVQESANDAARSTIPGLTAPERVTLAQASVNTSLTRAGMLDPLKATVTVNDDGTTVVVHVVYDASGNALLHSTFLPMPTTMIDRAAAIQLSGL